VGQYRRAIDHHEAALATFRAIHEVSEEAELIRARLAEIREE
jgi:hypothetical protein